MTDYNIPLENAPLGAAANLDTRAPLNPIGSQIPMNVQPFKPIDIGLASAQAYKNAETAGEYEMAQAERMDKMKELDTKHRDLAILKAWQGSGHSLYSENDLTLALHELGSKLSPEASQRLVEQLDTAKKREASATELASKASIEQLQYAKDAGDYAIESMRSVQAAYDAAIKKNPNDVQGALQAFNAAKAARIAAAKAAVNPVNDKPMFPPEKIAEMEKATPETLPNLLAYTENGMKMLNASFANKLKEAQAAKATADTAKSEASTENIKGHTAQLDELLNLKKEQVGIMQQRATAAIEKAKSSGQFSEEDAQTAAGMIASYNMAPLAGFSMRSPYGQRVMALVHQINPDYDATDYARKQKTVNDFATGVDGRTVRAFNTAVNHLDTLDKLTDALSNHDTKAINQLANVFKTQFGEAPPVEFDAAKQLVGGEIIKAITNGNGGVTEREHLQDMLDKANSPEALHGVIADYRSFMADQIKSLRNQYESNVGGAKGFDRLLLGSSQEVEEKGPHAEPKDFPKVTPGEQKARDNARTVILQQELTKEQDNLKNAKTDEDKHRYQSNIDAINRELGNKATAKKAVPSGVPADSKVIGKTPDGKEVWQSPDGKKWVE